MATTNKDQDRTKGTTGQTGKGDTTRSTTTTKGQQGGVADRDQGKGGQGNGGQGTGSRGKVGSESDRRSK